MSEIKPSQAQPVELWCRFAMAAGVLSRDGFRVFDFPGCKGCPTAQHTVRTLGSSEDPINAEALLRWIASAYRVKFDLPRLDLPTSPDLSWFPWTGRRNEWS